MKTAKATRKSIRPKAKAKSRTKATKAKLKKTKKKSSVGLRPKAKSQKPKALKNKPMRAVRVPAAKAKKGPDKVTSIADSREYDRRVWVRLDADSKELIRKVAAGSGLSPYIGHFAAEAAKAGKTLVATPATEVRNAGIMVRFVTPAVKKMVAAIAKECGVSMSAYAAHFALEAAKAGRKMAEEKESAVAS
jgi:hypothetical protein